MQHKMCQLNDQRRVCHPLVVQMQFAENKTELAHVLVLKITQEIHTKVVDQNALSAPTVHLTELVSETNAKTHALELAVKMPIAKL